MKSIMTIAVKLLIITLIAGAVLGVVYSVTKDPIAEQEIIRADKARFTAFPQAESFEELTDNNAEQYDSIKTVHAALDDQGNKIGVTIAMVTKGYSNGLNLTVGIGSDGVVKGVVLGSHQETPGLGAKAGQEDFIGQFAGNTIDVPLDVVKTAPSKQSDIEAISGATITSDAFTQAVNTAMAYYLETSGGTQ